MSLTHQRLINDWTSIDFDTLEKIVNYVKFFLKNNWEIGYWDIFLLEKENFIYDIWSSSYPLQNECMSKLWLTSLQNFINYTIFNQIESNQMNPLDIDVKNRKPKELPHFHF